MQRLRYSLLLILPLTLPGCSGDTGPSAGAGKRASQVAGTPADPEIEQLYNRSCRSCHAYGTANAPRTGDSNAWAERKAQGIDVLLEHTVNGYGSMPARGMCYDCSDDQLRALILFMSGGGQK